MVVEEVRRLRVQLEDSRQQLKGQEEVERQRGLIQVRVGQGRMLCAAVGLKLAAVACFLEYEQQLFSSQDSLLYRNYACTRAVCMLLCSCWLCVC
jgi:hypothetical protein